jgi:predicted PurR-regulated permease PerM
VGIAVLFAIALCLLGLIGDLVIPLVFAAILAAIFVPLVDRLERWRLSRCPGWWSWTPPRPSGPWGSWSRPWSRGWGR